MDHARLQKLRKILRIMKLLHSCSKELKEFKEHEIEEARNSIKEALQLLGIIAGDIIVQGIIENWEAKK